MIGIGRYVYDKVFGGRFVLNGISIGNISTFCQLLPLSAKSNLTLFAFECKIKLDTKGSIWASVVSLQPKAAALKIREESRGDGAGRRGVFPCFSYASPKLLWGNSGIDNWLQFWRGYFC